MTYAPTVYAAALARSERGDTTVDYTWLRIQTAARNNFDEKSWVDMEKAMSLIDTDPGGALALAKARMDNVWTDFMAHIVAKIALKKLGRDADAAREETIATALTNSISAGHKGTTVDDAFNAVSRTEESRVLLLFQLKSDHQSMVVEGGENFDVYDEIDPRDHQPRKVWFNIDTFYEKLPGV